MDIAAGALADLVGNEIAVTNFTNVLDSAAPILVYADVRDQDANGKIDSLTFIFSEGITGFVAGDFDGVYGRNFL